MPRWQDTYEALTGERYADLCAYASLFASDADGAASLVATAVERVLARGRTFPATDAVEADVRRVIARSAVAAARGAEEPAPHGLASPREKAPVPQDSAFAPPAPHGDPLPEDIQGSPTQKPTHDDLAAALAALHPRTRAVVILHHLDGLTVRRIAEVTGIRGDEVSSRLRDGGTELARRAGVTVPSTPSDDALAHVEMTVTTAPSRKGRRG